MKKDSHQPIIQGRSIFFVFIAGIFLGIAFFLIRARVPNPDVLYIGNLDWDLHISWPAAARQIILRYGQFPLWNPYRCGGVPLLGEPESDVLSPLFPLILAYGPVVGYINSFVIGLGVGLYGFYMLARSYRISRLGSVLVGVTYTLSGLIIIPFAVGATNFLSVAYLPYLFLFFERYLRSGLLRYAIFSSLIASFMFLSGFHYVYIIILYLIAVTFIYGLIQKDIESIRKFVIVIFLFLSLSAIKFFPSLDVVFSHPIQFQPGEAPEYGYSVKTLLFSLVSRNQTRSDFRHWGGERPGFFDGLSYGLEENGMYVGVVIFSFFLLGFLVGKKSFFGQHMIFIFFLLLAFGTNIPFIYSFFQGLPFFSDMRVAERFRYIFMVPFALFAGYGFDIFWQYIKKYFGNNTVISMGAFLCVGALIVDLIVVNSRAFRETFRVNSMTPNSPGFFAQTCLTENEKRDGGEYRRIFSNQGVINCVDNVFFDTHAICVGDPRYREETYLLYDHNIVPVKRFSPNIIQIVVSPVKNDVLVINQNYDLGWRVKVNGKKGKVISTNGLISTPVEQGFNNVIFYYMPLSVLIGGIVTMVSLGLSLYILLPKHIKRFSLDKVWNFKF